MSPQGHCGIPLGSHPVGFQNLLREWRTFEESARFTAPNSEAQMEVVILGRKIYSGHLLNKPSETKKIILDSVCTKIVSAFYILTLNYWIWKKKSG